MGLSPQIVNLVRLHFLNDAGEVGGVRKITVVHQEIHFLFMTVLIDVIHPLGIEQ